MAKILVGRVLNSGTDSVTAVQGAAGVAAWPVKNFAQLVPEEYDYMSLGYTGENLTTVTYKTGGAGGPTVATLTLTYTVDQLTSITRT